MAPDRQKAMPKRHQIANELRQRIASREYQPGAKLPPLPDLMIEFSAARETVRDAITRLANEGLVTPMRGVGTVVRNSSPVELSYSPGQAARVWSAQTNGGTDVVIRTGWELPDPDIAARLALPPNSRVVHRERHQSDGPQVVQIHEQWIPEHLAAAIKEGTGVDLADPEVEPPRDLFTLLQECGYKPVEITETLLTRMPDPDESGVMELPPGVPVSITIRITRDPAKMPVETSTVVGAGDRIRHTYTVRIP
jgi:GntR family transcriptional regulator